MTLSRKWNFACGRPLSEENIYHLACKAFQTDDLDPENFKEKHLTWTKFGKEVLTGCNFTFWEWFHSMLSLTLQHMEELWKKGYVMGFFAKAKVESLLYQQPPGTFLLRFSDSMIGGVSIGFLNLGKLQKYKGTNVIFLSMVLSFFLITCNYFSSNFQILIEWIGFNL